MNRQEERAVWRKVLAQCGSRLAALTKVKALERLVDQKDRLRCQQPERPQGAFGLSLGKGADWHAHQRCQGKIGDPLGGERCGAPRTNRGSIPARGVPSRADL